MSAVYDVPVPVGNTNVDGSGTPGFLLTNADGSVVTAPATNVPSGHTPQSAGAVGTTAAIAATLANVTGKTTYANGFQVTGMGATSAQMLTVTIVGLLGGTRTWYVGCPIGVGVPMAPLIINFPVPLPASAISTDLVLNVSGPGAGCPGISANIQGFTK